MHYHEISEEKKWEIIDDYCNSIDNRLAEIAKKHGISKHTVDTIISKYLESLKTKK